MGNRSGRVSVEMIATGKSRRETNPEDPDVYVTSTVAEAKQQDYVRAARKSAAAAGNGAPVIIASGHAGAFRQPPPPPLPSGWVALTEESSGDVYYWQEDTGVTTWDRPLGSKYNV